MAKRKVQEPPKRNLVQRLEPGLDVLDRFSTKDLDTWLARSKDLDELHQRLYFATQPERIARKTELTDALNVKPTGISFTQWFRLVEHRWSNDPLGAKGSLKSYGGRFNIGQDIEHSIGRPFPALYFGDSYETAWREYHQVPAKSGALSGLTVEELSLSGSMTSVRVHGRIERILDVTDPYAIAPVCRILAKIKMPNGIPQLLRRLRAPKNAIQMVRTTSDLQRAITANWRTWPIQFGLPSPSQQFAELVVAAGYEAIRYKSSNSSGYCLAVFPANLGNDNSFVELIDSAPDNVSSKRLDLESAELLSGWDCLSPRLRQR